MDTNFTYTNLVKSLDTHSQTWNVLKLYLQAEEKNAVSKLIGCSSHDVSNELRGTIKLIRLLLKVEEDARKGL
jgi:hypothetical protein